MSLTVKEAAECLGVSTALVYALCAERRIKHERHGLRRGKILISEEALAEYREGLTVEVKPREAEKIVRKPPVLKHLRIAKTGPKRAKS